MAEHVTDWIQAISTIVIALTLLVYWHQLRAMRQQLNATQTQLEDNRKSIAAAQHQAALQLMFDWRSEIIEFSELAEGYEESPYYKTAFELAGVRRYYHTLKLFNIYQHFSLLGCLEVVDRTILEGWERNLEISLGRSQTRNIWECVKSVGTFNPGFVATVDAIINKANSASASMASGSSYNNSD